MRQPVHQTIEFIRSLVRAIRHVRTGGQSTVQTARRRAAQPARRCSQCHQPVRHSADYRDHLH